MASQGRAQQNRNGERHTKPRQTEGDEELSHRATARRVREADRFALQLPMIGRVPFPRPDQLAFYGALAALVAFELVEWPVAVAIGAGHALVSNHPRQPEKSPSDDDRQE
jgi:hypothetical protein